MLTNSTIKSFLVSRVAEKKMKEGFLSSVLAELVMALKVMLTFVSLLSKFAYLGGKH